MVDPVRFDPIPTAPARANGARSRDDTEAALAEARAAAQAAAERDRRAHLEAELNARLSTQLPPNTRLSIGLDGDTGTYIYRTVDRTTGEVLRQWPLEDMLEFAGFMRELEALAVDRKV